MGYRNGNGTTIVIKIYDETKCILFKDKIDMGDLDRLAFIFYYLQEKFGIDINSIIQMREKEYQKKFWE